MDNNKVSGPDGYNALFFKKAWNIIADDIFAAVNKFFMSGKLLKQINHALIALIPKSDQASQVNHFRPISCCNLLYKIISKILANRIASVLEHIIGASQSAFRKNRKMMDNIFLVQELLRKYARKRISPRCLLKIDLHKAYDSISWEFLDWMLKSMGFPAQFCSWIMECITTTSFSLVVNGSIYGHFKGQHGLSQVDPLSPYLFVLCLEHFPVIFIASRVTSTFSFTQLVLLFSFHTWPSQMTLCSCPEETYLLFQQHLLSSSTFVIFWGYLSAPTSHPFTQREWTKMFFQISNNSLDLVWAASLLDTWVFPFYLPDSMYVTMLPCFLILQALFRVGAVKLSPMQGRWS